MTSRSGKNGRRKGGSKQASKADRAPGTPDKSNSANGDDASESRYREWINPRGALQLSFKDGKAVWKYLPLRCGIRKATKKEAREFMKQARGGLGLVTIGKKRRKSA
jgi:hypothetical protein